MKKQRRLVYDYETYSELDVTVCGPYKYANHPSTEITCLGYKIDDGPSKVWFPHRSKIPKELKECLNDEETIVVAHNFAFEFNMHNYVLRKKYCPEIRQLKIFRSSCTAARAALQTYPRKLEHLAEALHLPHKKDMEGHRLMLKMAKPKKPSKKDPSTRHNSEEQFDRLGKYCLSDIETEYHADKVLPELPPMERKLWSLDQKMNARGVKADIKLCRKIIKLINEFIKIENRRLQALTEGEVNKATQVKELLKFINGLGAKMEKLDKNAVSLKVNQLSKIQNRSINQNIILECLRIRRGAGKTSTGKFQAFIDRADENGVCRDIWMYCGAATRRWAGRGIQFQNLPRPLALYEDYTIDEVEALEFADIEYIQKVYSNPMGFFSTIIRSMILVDDGERMLCADYNAIELRVLMWLVGCALGLKMIKNGEDMYCALADDIFGRKITKEDKFERFTGKEGVLGAGYQMGPPKFKKSVFDKTLSQNPDGGGVVISDELSVKTIKAYRKKFKEVPEFWYGVEKAAINCVRTKKPVVYGKIKFVMRDGDHLYCILPSGGELSYPNAKLKLKTDQWGKQKVTLYHGRMNKAGRWISLPTYGGKLTENIVQAIARDVMAHGMLSAETKGYPILKTIHDELTAKKGKGTLEEFEKIMVDAPPWAYGMPLKTEGFETFRFRK